MQCSNCQKHWNNKSKLWSWTSIKPLKEQENTKAAETAGVNLGFITNVNKKLLLVVVYIAAQLTFRDQNGISCVFGRTSFFEEQ